MNSKLSASLFLGVSLTVLSPAADWPQYRGPNHDGGSPEKVLQSWPANGPRTVWKVPTPGGFSVFSVAGGRAFTLVAREIEGTRREVLLALDANTGKELWAAPLGEAKYDGGGDSGADGNQGGDGPRSTPTSNGRQVFVLDARLKLTSFDAATGQPGWSKDLVKDVGAKNIQWQNAASPVLDNNRLFVCSGAEGGSLIAFNPADGAILWKGENDAMTHATPVVADILGVRQVVFFTQAGLVSADVATGKVLWRFPFQFRVSTAASPVVAGDIVYCSAGYDVGSGAARISKDGDAFKATELWKLTGSAATKARLLNHWSTPVAKDGYLYGMFGFKDYTKGALKCVELATGKEVWSQADFGPGGVILAGGSLVALSDRGEVVLIDPQPAAYKELARTKAIEGKCWNNPSLSGGRLFVRGTKEGACLDVAPAPASAGR